jgi:hypothetical protein
MIPLSQGKVAVIDDDDYELVIQYPWSAHKQGNTWYAYTNLCTFINGKLRRNITMHRLVMGDACIGLQVDHINHDGLDNRRSCNLRTCNRSQNLQNSIKTTLSTTSSYKGVSWQKRDKCWQSMIGVNGKPIHIGKFTIELEAAKAYDIAALEHFGQFACTNF